MGTWKGEGLDSPRSMTSRDQGSMREGSLWVHQLFLCSPADSYEVISSQLFRGSWVDRPPVTHSGDLLAFLNSVLFFSFPIPISWFYFPPVHYLHISFYLHTSSDLRHYFLEQSWLRYLPK